MSGLDLSLGDVEFRDSVSGVDRTAAAMEMIKAKCPELLSMFVRTDVFKAYGGGPKEMAEKYKIPFLGKLPLDPGLLLACEVSPYETQCSEVFCDLKFVSYAMLRNNRVIQER